MSYDLTPERRAVLRRYAEVIQSAAYETTMLAHYGEMLALLDAADEHDRLAAAVRQIAEACHWSHDPSDDPEALSAYIGQLQRSADDALDAAAAIERVRVLADGWRYKGEFGWGAWQEGYGPDEHGLLLDDAACKVLRALDGADDGTTT